MILFDDIIPVQERGYLEKYAECSVGLFSDYNLLTSTSWIVSLVSLDVERGAESR